jgi:hypothetical protein
MTMELRNRKNAEMRSAGFDPAHSSAQVLLDNAQR